MTVISKTTNANYNFVAPEITADTEKKVEVVFPTQEVVTGEAESNITIDIVRAFTGIELTVKDDIELTLSAGVSVKVGDAVLLAATADGDDYMLTVGDNEIELTDGAKKSVLLIFNGTTFDMVAQKGEKGEDGSDGADGADGLFSTPLANCATYDDLKAEMIAAGLMLTAE